MRTAGIICEFNPLHNGHKHLIGSVRESLSPDAVVCVMSGDHVQRGAPALADKFERAKSALCAGADLVLELPVYHAVQSAAEFALGGARTLAGLGCDMCLCFGSESADADGLLGTAAAVTERREEIDERIGHFLAEGLSYPAAYEKACLAAGIRVPKDPNDILALEYIKASLSEGAGFSFKAVKRAGSRHGDMSGSGRFASSSYIRQLLSEGRSEEAESFMPPVSAGILREDGFFDGDCAKRYFELARYLLLTAGGERLADIPEMREGLENRLRQAARRAEDLDGLISLAKTKRYTYAGMSRIICQLILGLSKKTYTTVKADGLRYGRVLAFNGDGAKVLACAKEAGLMPIVSNINRLPEGSPVRALADSDTRASLIYNMLRGKDLEESSDMLRIPSLSDAKRP